MLPARGPPLFAVPGSGIWKQVFEKGQPSFLGENKIIASNRIKANKEFVFLIEEEGNINIRNGQ